jgi:asparagine synthase (glutamine-hydrolysing)
LGRAGQIRRLSLLRKVDTPVVREADAPDALLGAVKAAVARAMDGARSVGVLVSGGVDSSAVLATACSLAAQSTSHTSVSAYTFDFDTPDPGDDRPYRHALLRRLKLEADRVTPRDAAPSIRNCMVLDAMPCVGLTSALEVEAGRRARGKGAQFLLTGIGGDTVVEGRTELFGDLARRGKILSAVLGAVRLRGQSGGGPAWRVRNLVLKPLVAPLFPQRWRRARRRRSIARSYPWAGPRLRRWIDAHVETAGPQLPSLGSTPTEWYQWLAGSPFFAQTATGRAQIESASGCTYRDPLFDDDLIATVAALPPLSLFHDGWRRGLFRHVMRGIVPDEVRLRPNKAYLDSAAAHMVQSIGGFAALADLADVRTLADLGLAEPREFRRTFDRLAADPFAALWWSVWPALASEAFLRHYASGSYA